MSTKNRIYLEPLKFAKMARLIMGLTTIISLGIMFLLFNYKQTTGDIHLPTAIVLLLFPTLLFYLFFLRFRKYLTPNSKNGFDIVIQYGIIKKTVGTIDLSEIKKVELTQDQKKYYVLNILKSDDSKILVHRSPTKLQVQTYQAHIEEVLLTSANTS